MSKLCHAVTASHILALAFVIGATNLSKNSRMAVGQVFNLTGPIGQVENLTHRDAQPPATAAIKMMKRTVQACVFR